MSKQYEFAEEALAGMGLGTDEFTRKAAKMTGHKVFTVIGQKEMVVSTYDFLRGIKLPDGILSISQHEGKIIYQLHFPSAHLGNLEYLKWIVESIKLQIYLSKEFDQ